MEALIAIARPDMAIFTAIDKVHALNFRSMDEILFEKTRLLMAARDMIFYPSDGEYILPYVSALEVEKLSYSLCEDTAHEADIGYNAYTLMFEKGQVCASFDLMQ